MKSWVRWVVKLLVVTLFSLAFWFGVSELYFGSDVQDLFVKGFFWLFVSGLILSGDLIFSRLFGSRTISMKETEKEFASLEVLRKRAWLAFHEQKPFGGYEKARDYILSHPLFLSNKDVCLFSLGKPGIEPMWMIVPTFSDAKFLAYSPALTLKALLRIYAVNSPEKFFSTQDTVLQQKLEEVVSNE